MLKIRKHTLSPCVAWFSMEEFDGDTQRDYGTKFSSHPRWKITNKRKIFNESYKYI